jgi:hypothetical protein
MGILAMFFRHRSFDRGASAYAVDTYYVTVAMITVT